MRANDIASLDSLFRPRSVAVVGASPNDPSRMGTRTFHDLVESDWRGEVYPVSKRHREIYGRHAFASLRDVPAAPDVVLARVPASGVADVVADAAAVGARHLVVLASGFAETGTSGQGQQSRLLEAAAHAGLRILGPQSIGLVNLRIGLPLSLSQIMERLQMRAGSVALLTQSGAMAIALSVRGQELYGIDFSYIATVGNAADIDVPEAVSWLAADEATTVVSLYLESTGNLARLADAFVRCRQSGKQVVVLRAGSSAKGAKAVASHTASMAGDARTFEALCSQLGVVLVDSGESFLVALKALSGRVPAAPVRTAFASVSGGACALWADAAERWHFQVPELDVQDAQALGRELPPFLAASNPLDLGPAVFDASAFAASISALASSGRFDLLVVYLFTSSPTLMGGLEKIEQLETIAADAAIPVWVAWEAATDEEWARLVRSPKVVAFRELAHATEAAGHVVAARKPPRYRATVARPSRVRLAPGATEAAIKQALRGHRLQVPEGAVVPDVAHAITLARQWNGPVALKIHGDVAHKSELGGVVLCPAGADQVPDGFDRLVDNLRRHGIAHSGVYMERLVEDPGLEMFVTVRFAPDTGWITTVGRGGTAIELERDFAIRLGELDADSVLEMLESLRCGPLLGGFRGASPLDARSFAALACALPSLLGTESPVELELNPVKVTAHGAWVLDALLRR